VFGLEFAEARLKEKNTRRSDHELGVTRSLRDYTIGWKKGKPVVRITTVNVALCTRMGVSVENFALELLKARNT
jgi:hypothetical protein